MPLFCISNFFDVRLVLELVQVIQSLRGVQAIQLTLAQIKRVLSWDRDLEAQMLSVKITSAAILHILNRMFGGILSLWYVLVHWKIHTQDLLNYIKLTLSF
jgi:hypothetical protein